MSNMPLLMQLTSTFTILNTYMSQVEHITSNTFCEKLSAKDNIERGYTAKELFANEKCLTLPVGLYEIELELPFFIPIHYTNDVKVWGSFEVKVNNKEVYSFREEKFLPKETDTITINELAKDTNEVARRKNILLRCKSNIFEIKNPEDKVEFRFFNTTVNPVAQFPHGNRITFDNAKLKIYQL